MLKKLYFCQKINRQIMSYINQLIKQLEWSEIKDFDLPSVNGLVWGKNIESLNIAHRLKNSLLKVNPTAVYVVDNSPLILIFEILENEDVENTIHKNAWNFNYSPVVFIIKFNELKIFNGFSLLKNNKLALLTTNSTEENNFSFWNIHSGQIWKTYEAAINNEKRLDYYLLHNIEYAIKTLSQIKLPHSRDKKKEIDNTDRIKIITTNGKENGNLNRYVANSLVGRLVFVRYLIDRDVKLGFKYISCEKQREDFLQLILEKDKLYELFDYLKNETNGDLFPLLNNTKEGKDLRCKEEKEYVTDRHLELLHKLFSGGDLPSKQGSLFDIYDFNIIPVELISNIYERFIGKEKQDNDSAFYTPPFLVDYILENTVTQHLQKNDTCRVLDPSCGSGIFLVETLRKIITKHKQQKGNLSNNELCKIVSDNIFGIDKDINAINVSIFSLYITLLDYKEPKEIMQFQLPEVKNKNFWVDNFFNPDLKETLKNTLSFKNTEFPDFDFIIGNPPWGSKKDDSLHKKFVQNNSEISDYQIAQSFLLRTQDFCTKNQTKCALIISSKILYNIDANKFRTRFLKTFALTQVFELSAVRKLIFNGAIAPCAILFYHYPETFNPITNNIQHISLKPNRFLKLFKKIVIEKYDSKPIAQQYFLQHDWLWKVLLYGNVLDYFFIKRLKEDFETINDIINAPQNQLIIGSGFKHTDGNKKKFTEEFDTHYYIDVNPRSKTNSLSRYVLNYSKLWDGGKVGFLPQNKDGFYPPMILIKKGLNANLNCISAFSERKIFFTNGATSIKGSSNQVTLLKMLIGFLNSSFFNYYIISLGSKAGVEREEAYTKTETFNLPVVVDDTIAAIVAQIEQLDFNGFDYPQQLAKLETQLNNRIAELFSLSNIEKNLIDYALNISIPLFQQKEEPYTPIKKNEDWERYVAPFLQHFGYLFGRQKLFFQVDIYIIANYFVAMEFKVVKEKPEQLIHYSNNLEKRNYFTQIARLSVTSNNQQSNDNIFVQKDIKGFEAESFYVIKPNERKNWHPAVAHLDIGEFTDAILRNEAKKSNNNYARRKPL